MATSEKNVYKRIVWETLKVGHIQQFACCDCAVVQSCAELLPVSGKEVMSG